MLHLLAGAKAICDTNIIWPVCITFFPGVWFVKAGSPCEILLMHSCYTFLSRFSFSVCSTSTKMIPKRILENKAFIILKFLKKFVENYLDAWDEIFADVWDGIFADAWDGIFACALFKIKVLLQWVMMCINISVCEVKVQPQAVKGNTCIRWVLKCNTLTLSNSDNEVCIMSHTGEIYICSISAT